MHLRLDEETIEKIEKITCTEYNRIDNFVDTESVVDMIDDLLYEIDTLQEKISDMEQDIEENYKPIPVAEQYEISDKDFL